MWEGRTHCHLPAHLCPCQTMLLHPLPKLTPSAESMYSAMKRADFSPMLSNPARDIAMLHCKDAGMLDHCRRHGIASCMALSALQATDPVLHAMLGCTGVKAPLALSQTQASTAFCSAPDPREAPGLGGKAPPPAQTAAYNSPEYADSCGCQINGHLSA